MREKRRPIHRLSKMQWNNRKRKIRLVFSKCIGGRKGDGDPNRCDTVARRKDAGLSATAQDTEANCTFERI